MTSAPADPDIAWTLARHLARTRFEDLDGEVMAATKRSILDTLGVLVAAGTLAPGLDHFVELVREGGGRLDSSVLGFGFKAPAWMAAFANGAMAHALDFEEVSLPLGHPSANTVPAALAVAERIGLVNGPASGQQIITATAVGNDLFIRLVRSFPTDGPWHKVTLAGHFAAAATAGKLLALDEERMVDALGLAFCQTSGTMELRFGVDSNIGGFRDAFSNKAGVLSALLAERGVHGVRSCFDGKAGLYNAFFDGQGDQEALTDDLGLVLRTAAAQKPWPSCGGTHGHIDAALRLVEEQRIDLDEVLEVTAFVGDTTRNLCEPLDDRRRPATTLDAKYSIPFATAVAMVKGAPTLNDFSEAGLRDPSVLAMAAKVVPCYDEAFDHQGGLRPARIDLRMQDGSVRSQHVDLPRYHRDPMGWDDLVEKFRDCVSHGRRPLSTDDVDRVIDDVANLEEVGIGGIMELLG